MSLSKKSSFASRATKKKTTSRMRAFLFDIDGTLIQSGGAGRAALDAAFAEVFGIGDGTRGIMLSGRTDSGIQNELFETHGIEPSPANRQHFLQAYLAHLPRLLAERQGAILPGISTLLDELAGCSRSLVGLLTGNVREGARLKLEHFGIYHHFSFGGFGDDHGDRDDVARCAVASLEAIYPERIPPEQVVVIGDTPSDVRCARAIGAQVVAVATGEFTAEQLAAENPDLLLDNLSDSSSLLAKW